MAGWRDNAPRRAEMRRPFARRRTHTHVRRVTRSPPAALAPDPARPTHAQLAQRLAQGGWPRGCTAHTRCGAVLVGAQHPLERAPHPARHIRRRNTPSTCSRTHTRGHMPRCVLATQTSAAQPHLHTRVRESCGGRPATRSRLRCHLCPCLPCMHAARDGGPQPRAEDATCVHSLRCVQHHTTMARKREPGDMWGFARQCDCARAK